MNNLLKLISLLFVFFVAIQVSAQEKPVRIGLDGLTHSHVYGLLRTMNESNSPIRIVGIAESNKALVKYYADIVGFDTNMVYDTVEEMIEKTKPEGVMAFNSIYEHLKTVEACAPKGIHVMVEKPLAVNMEHASKMEKLAQKHNIMLLTNYETTWYPSNHKVYEMVKEKNSFGDIRKVIVCDGHEGPIEIGVEKEFTDWLTDPVLNGGGAVIDFGCYGINLMTWLMDNELPMTVSATLQQHKPHIYPKVDDEATIILTYPKSQAIVQGSWNWPVGRKDIEVYGEGGYIKAPDANNVSYKFAKTWRQEVVEQPVPLKASHSNVASYFSGCIRGDVKVENTDLSSLENNIVVVKVLDAARESAKTGKVIRLK